MLSANPDTVRLAVVREPGEAYQAQPGTKRERRYRIQPPPKIVLELDEADGSKCNWLENPRTFLMARLPAKPDILFGKTVESIQRIGDQATFIFRDLSVMEAGEHRLRFTLFSRDSDSEPAYMVKHIDSQPFVVLANRSARRRSDKNKNSPRLRHRIDSRGSLNERVRLEPKRKHSTPTFSDEPKYSPTETHVSSSITPPRPSDLTPITPSSSSTGHSSYDSMGFLSSPPAWQTNFATPLGIYGLDATRPRMQQQPFLAHSNSFDASTAYSSMPMTTCDSSYPLVAWGLEDSGNETDQLYNVFGEAVAADGAMHGWDASDAFAPAAYLQNDPLPVMMQPPQWRMEHMT